MCHSRSTGVAALNVNGSTYHFFLRLGKTASYNALRGLSLLKFQRACASHRYIIIDELSMLGCRALLAVDQCLRQARPDISSVLFRGFSIILFGSLSTTTQRRVGLTPTGGLESCVSLAVEARIMLRANL